MKVTNGTLLILNPAWTMIRRAVLARPALEVYGMGHCVVDEDGMAVMDNIYIPPQEVTAGKFEVSGDELIKAFSGLVKEHGPKWIEWCVMWHSHCGMGVDPSNTDTANLAQLVRNNMDYAIGLVVNVRGDAFAWAELTVPWETQAELDVIVGDANYPKLEKLVDGWMEHVVEKKVTQPKLAPSAVVYRRQPWWAKDEDKDEENKNGEHTSDDGPSSEGWSASDDLMQMGLTFADGAIEKFSAKSIDKLAVSVIAGQREGSCDAEHGDIKCILVKNHKQKVHVGVVDTMPAYFQASGKPPSVATIQAAGFPI